MIRLAIRARAEDAERVLAGLLEIAPSGVEQVDGDGYVEYAVYGMPGELPSLPDGQAQVAGVKVTVSGREVADDWHERWKDFHEPVLIGERLLVRAPWDEPPDRAGREEIVIDPGRAFGTGTHATTRLCLELMLDLEPAGPLADLGCGSGVLAIAAAKLGFAPVVAYDYDRLAVEATLENARANGVSLDRVERLDVGMATPRDAVDTVVANLMLPLLVRLPELWEQPPRVLVASGLLEEEADLAAATFAPLVERRRLSRGGWSALLMTA